MSNVDPSAHQQCTLDTPTIIYSAISTDKNAKIRRLLVFRFSFFPKSSNKVRNFKHQDENANENASFDSRPFLRELVEYETPSRIIMSLALA